MLYFRIITILRFFHYHIISWWRIINLMVSPIAGWNVSLSSNIIFDFNSSRRWFPFNHSRDFTKQFVSYYQIFRKGNKILAASDTSDGEHFCPAE